MRDPQMNLDLASAHPNIMYMIIPKAFLNLVSKNGLRPSASIIYKSLRDTYSSVSILQ